MIASNKILKPSDRKYTRNANGTNIDKVKIVIIPAVVNTFNQNQTDNETLGIEKPGEKKLICKGCKALTKHNIPVCALGYEIENDSGVVTHTIKCPKPTGYEKLRDLLLYSNQRNEIF
ncbi:hypothetical protein [Methylomonas sp. AM2-LC]|uniref:hypothetical protein n=1 Tax=Methylomonas sp. AM2-LC TaxID=3153301 RepID=UPI003266E04C